MSRLWYAIRILIDKKNTNRIESNTCYIQINGGMKDGRSGASFVENDL